MKRGGCLLAGLFPVIILLLLVVVFHQHRHFHQVGDMVFTFWRTSSGYTYIMPYRYMGLIPPRDNYMKTVNTAGIFIVIGEGSMLYIFPLITYVIGGDRIEVNLSSFEYRYYPFVRGIDNVRAFFDTMYEYMNSGYPFIRAYFPGLRAPEISHGVMSANYREREKP